jgi:hypothetical protein
MGKKLAYGLTCDVHFDWPWAPSAPDAAPAAELRIELGSLGPYAGYPEQAYTLHAERTRDDPSGRPIVRVDRGSDGHFRVRYADGAVFAIDPDAKRIFGISGPDLSLDDLVVYLQGPILGFALRLRGVTCLHASAVVVDGIALAFVGDGGMGKSTSAACFARMGLPVLTDDVLALEARGDSGFAVQPGLPRVMLWDESVQALWGAPEALPLVVAGWEKRFLDLNQSGYRHASQAAPLGAVYLLGERLAPDAPVEFSAVTGTEALMTLVTNTYANDFLDRPRRAQELEVLGRLVNHVPVRRLRAPEDRLAVQRICQAVLADFAALRER